MRWLVFLIVLVNFLIGLIGVAYAFSLVTRLGVLSGEFSALALWAILTAFCNVCMAYWVAEDGDSIRELTSRRRIKVKKGESDEERKKIEEEEIEEFERLELRCRTCAKFKKSECPRGEENGNAELCDEYVLLLEKPI